MKFKEMNKRGKPNAKQNVKKAEKRLPRVTERAKLRVPRIFSPRLYKIDEEEAIVWEDG